MVPLSGAPTQAIYAGPDALTASFDSRAGRWSGSLVGREPGNLRCMAYHGPWIEGNRQAMSASASGRAFAQCDIAALRPVALAEDRCSDTGAIEVPSPI
jgi:hypothetical protein